MFVDKINRIFDEVKKEADVQQSQPAGGRHGARDQKLVDTSQQANEYSIDGRQKEQSPIKSQKRVKIALDDDDQEPEPRRGAAATQPFQAAHPFVVPVIINQQNQSAHTGLEQGRGAQAEGLNPDQLRDMIQQAVATQLQLHQLRTEGNSSQPIDPTRSYDSIRTTQTLRDEEMKLRVEQQMLNKQIPVNVQPQIVQSLGMASQAPATATAYINPFSNSAQPGPFSIKPPLLSDLTGFDLGVDDSSSDFADYEAQLKKRGEQLDRERSDGELELGAVHESLGEIPSKSSMAKAMKSVQGRGAAQGFRKDNRPLGQVQDGYEGGGARTGSADDFDVADSTDALPSGNKLRSRKDIDNPIFDSKEEPLPKTKQAGANYGRGVATSGDSFGPMMHSSGGMQEAIKNAKNRRARGIPEDCLEYDDD